jgi:hypothetical protein
MYNFYFIFLFKIKLVLLKYNQNITDNDFHHFLEQYHIIYNVQIFLSS